LSIGWGGGFISSEALADLAFGAVIGFDESIDEVCGSVFGERFSAASASGVACAGAVGVVAGC